MRDNLRDWVYANVPKRPDLVVCNGDAVDGDGRRSGGTEQLTTDPIEQAEWATAALKRFRGKQYMMTYGTPYHTGVKADYEDIIAAKLGCEIKATLDIEVNGVRFNFKHKIGGSTIPHGRATALMRDKLWNDIWADRGEFPKADVMVRSHVHYHQYTGTHDYLALTTPALQGYGSKYGARQVSGTVDYGFTVFKVSKSGEMSWKAHILRMDYQEPVTL
jgi:hypothetical protein